MKEMVVHDHKTAVIAIIVYDGKVLLLKRNNPPLNWCPPGGRVNLGETLAEGLMREVKEESGLDVEIVKYAQQWEGWHGDEKIRSFTFVCTAKSDRVVLSDEHSEFKWVAIEDLDQWRDRTDFTLQDWPQWIDQAK